ncbi:hypothetical protein L7F22_016267 [Adiantum nelumboides]|nr:hypothetical protein [Adiantum nelumboides]
MVPPIGPKTPSYAKPPRSLIDTRSSSSQPSSSDGPRGVDKGKKTIDSEGFQSPPDKKTFNPRNLASGYTSSNVFDILQDMPSPETLEVVEVRVINYHQRKNSDPLEVNLKVNMQEVEEDT